MPGVPGSGGPVPKRSGQRRRRNAVDAPEQAAAGARAVWPEPDGAWHPAAADWYRSLAVSGQAVFYEASDVQMARVGAQVLSRLLAADRMSAQLMASWLQLASSLLATEGDRRRLRLELERAKVADVDADSADASVTSLLSRLGG